MTNLTAYIAYKTGYKSGGFSNTAIQSAFGSQADFAFNPERVTGFEGGLKGTLADRQLRFALGLYRYKFNDLQIDFFNATTISFITTNAGGAVIRGAELALELAPRAAPGLNLHSTLNYNRARYSNYLAPCYGGQSIADGCTLKVRGVPYQDLSGQPTGNAPLWAASLGAAYEHPLGSGIVGSLSADARYSGDYLASSFGNTTARQPSYVNLDASVRLRTADDRFELALIGRNLTNRFVITGSLDVVGTGGGTGTNNAVRSDQAGLVSLPRTIQVQATVRF